MVKHEFTSKLLGPGHRLLSLRFLAVCAQLSLNHPIVYHKFLLLTMADLPQQSGIESAVVPLEHVQVQPHEIFHSLAGADGEVNDTSDLALVELPLQP